MSIFKVFNYLFPYQTKNVLKTTNSEYKQKLSKRLKSEGIDDVELFEKLKETRSFISGGFALQVYLGEKWQDSDLDIFTDNNNINHYLRKKYKSYNLPERDFDYYDLFTIDYREYQEKYKLYISNYKSPSNLNIQVIRKGGESLLPTPTKELIETIHSEFDFDFCKVAFDGENLYIDKPKSLINRIGYVNSKYLHKPITPTLLSRIQKYSKRGFTIIQTE